MIPFGEISKQAGEVLDQLRYQREFGSESSLLAAACMSIHFLLACVVEQADYIKELQEELQGE